MSSKHVLLLRCNRCGNETTTAPFQPSGWRFLGGLSDPTRRVALAQDIPQIGGDLCGGCVAELVDWWRAGSRLRLAHDV